jgi:hypothetical protein
MLADAPFGRICSASSSTAQAQEALKVSSTKISGSILLTILASTNPNQHPSWQFLIASLAIPNLLMASTRLHTETDSTVGLQDDEELM